MSMDTTVYVSFSKQEVHINVCPDLTVTELTAAWDYEKKR
jgi:hypothetical protein